MALFTFYTVPSSGKLARWSILLKMLLTRFMNIITNDEIETLFYLFRNQKWKMKLWKSFSWVDHTSAKGNLHTCVLKVR